MNPERLNCGLQAGHKPHAASRPVQLQL